VRGKIAIIGYSGHGYVVADAAIDSGMPLTHYCDRGEKLENPFGLDYLGFEDDPNFLGWLEEFQYVLGIGDNLIRYNIGLKIRDRKKLMPNVIHRTASLSTKVNLGSGNFLSTNVSINVLTEIGDFCILNTGCIVEHECEIGNGVHIAPGAVLAGNVKVGDLSFIGANSVIKQGIKVGKNVTVGAGAVVLKDVADNLTIVGNPGRII
jgi:sugar O-acyltransferase (sialic acid O-acetyltransferase NeuD family)